MRKQGTDSKVRAFSLLKVLPLPQTCCKEKSFTPHAEPTPALPCQERRHGRPRFLDRARTTAKDKPPLLLRPEPGPLGAASPSLPP